LFFLKRQYLHSISNAFVSPQSQPNVHSSLSKLSFPLLSNFISEVEYQLNLMSVFQNQTADSLRTIAKQLSSQSRFVFLNQKKNKKTKKKK